MFSCNLIGAGRLGKNIALAFAKHQVVLMQAICNQTLESSRSAWRELGLNGMSCSLEQLPPADITLLACSDDAIATVAKQLAQQAIRPQSTVIHCSGALNSSVLEPLKEHGCFVASLHPLKSFKTAYLSAEAFNKVHVVIEGDKEACIWLNNSLMQLNAQIHTIPPKSKAAYHAAATMACNYLVTLAAVSEQLMAATGLQPDITHAMIAQLMQGTLDNLAHSNPATALTGPLMRGDIGTLARHVQAIDEPALNLLYKAAGLATLALTQLDEDKKTQIRTLLAIKE